MRRASTSSAADNIRFCCKPHPSKIVSRILELVVFARVCCKSRPGESSDLLCGPPTTKRHWPEALLCRRTGLPNHPPFILQRSFDLNRSCGNSQTFSLPKSIDLPTALLLSDVPVVFLLPFTPNTASESRSASLPLRLSKWDLVFPFIPPAPSLQLTGCSCSF